MPAPNGPSAGTRSVPAMGSVATISAWECPPDAIDRAIVRLADLENRWSRFRPDSEVSRLNAHAGTDVLVSSETFTLIHRSVAAWHLTGGRFDPTCGAAVVALGYDRDIAQLAGSVAMTSEGERAPATGGAGASNPTPTSVPYDFNQESTSTPAGSARALPPT